MKIKKIFAQQKDTTSFIIYKREKINVGLVHGLNVDPVETKIGNRKRLTSADTLSNISIIYVLF